MLLDVTISENTVAVSTVIRIGMNKVVKDIDILSQITARTANQSIGPVIMIV